MGQYTLREAAEITGRSVTTLRRYIRSGRLAADKTPGRFGPEFTVNPESLQASGFEIRTDRHESNGAAALAPEPMRGSSEAIAPLPRTGGLERVLLDYVPADLYRELAMKHEQLLVQYGMIRASGQKLYEFRDEAERRSEDLARAGEQLKTLQDRASREIGALKGRVRQAELDLESRNIEIAALREQVRTLELCARNAATTESIERQFQRIFEKERTIDALEAAGSDAAGEAPSTELVAAPRAEAPMDRLSPQDEERRRRLEALDRWLGSGTGIESAAPPAAPLPRLDAPDH